MSAVAATGIRRRDDFSHALRAVLLKGPAGSRVFDQVFYACFCNPRILQKMRSLVPPAMPCDSEDFMPDGAIRRLVESWADASQPSGREDATDIDGSNAYSAAEVFRRKDFAQMNPREQSAAQRLLREAAFDWPELPTRRYRTGASGRRYDLRRSVRLMLRNDGELVQLARRRPGICPPKLVLLCDISGSMSRYSRMFLHYAHALSTQNIAVQTFVFGTRLTNISRWLKGRDTGRALRLVSEKVPDWDGGTRIADSLKKFNLDWSRRVLAGHSRVVLVSDGLERDSHSRLGFEMERLRRSCGEVIWMNPMLRFAGFEPRASGVRSMLPHVDRFVAAHSIASVMDLGRILGSAPLDRATPPAGMPV
jgi:uncharacterized protein with von Willebrand factor type A (vWA) domain